MPRITSPEKKAEFAHYVQLGWSHRQAAEKAGISYNTARGWLERDAGFRRTMRPDGIDAPLPLNRLSKPAKRALKDIGYFAERYYGLVLLPFHYEDTKRILEWEATPRKEFVVINIAPGSGKTTFYTRVLPAWLTVRNRAIRGLLGSASHKLASRYTRILRSDFSRATPIQNDSDAVEQGWAKDARATLLEDYGRFRPLYATEETYWRQDGFIVEQQEGRAVGEKELTWEAFGQDSAQIGTRVNVAIWDDVYDVNKFRSREVKDNLFNWWSNTAEKRLEPNGLLILVGQRLAADDIYRYALDQKRLDDSGNLIPKYHHIVHKAHYDENCKGEETHKPDAEPWPFGCLLYPARITWTELSDEKINRPDVYEVVYQQNDEYASEDLIVRRLWIDGGKDPETGEQFEGCWDEDRDLCEWPHGLIPPLYSMASVDPSPANYWAIEWWLYHPASETRYLLDIFHGRQGGNDLLDWINGEQRFAGVMEDWQERSLSLGIPISHWIVEINAAQKFLLCYEHVRRWARQRMTTIVPHTTGINKTNSDLGLTTIGSKYKYAQVRLPAKSRAAKRKCEGLVHELIHLRKDFSHTTPDDRAMAHWMFEFNLPKLSFRGVDVAVQSRPTWVTDYFTPHYQSRR